ncbi:hypothetical protein C8Q75DRAFT_726758 [Abortiporus biennis]|nr:hypothetical protein C8Q75DRAFT_726758 [Abortiporus biennis]
MSALTILRKRSLRVARNYTGGYSDTKLKVRNATSTDAEPASQKQLDELVQLSHNPQDFAEIREIIDKRLNDKGRNWRHAYKSLILIEHLLLHGPESNFEEFKQYSHSVKTLREFEYVDDKGIDHGAHVRQKAKNVFDMISDSSALRSRRMARTIMRSGSVKSPGRSPAIPRSISADGFEDENTRRRDAALMNGALLNSEYPEEVDLQLAIAESHKTMLARQSGTSTEEKDVLRAINLSLETVEEERRVGKSANEQASQLSSPGASSSSYAPRLTSRAVGFA